MALKRKSTRLKDARISARLPAAVIARVDFVVRNIDGDGVENRSAAFLAALEAWLLVKEQRLEELGIVAKKAR